MIISIILIAAVVVAVWGILSSIKIETEEYVQEYEAVNGDVKIAALSDLHCRVFGEDNKELIALLEEQQPDIIVLAGDMINRDSNEKNIKKVCEFISQLPCIAPTYFSLGNHESDYIDENGDSFLNKVREAGATVLECEYEDLTVNGTTFRLGGMSELAYKDGSGKYDSLAEKFLTDYCSTDLPKIMISHRPEAFCFKFACKEWDVDLILSGHTHGGLIRLPVIGGVIAPIQGWFPDVYYGEYEFYGTRMIVTSGLAGYYWAPRMFNPPEICVITLTGKG